MNPASEPAATTRRSNPSSFRSFALIAVPVVLVIAVLGLGWGLLTAPDIRYEFTAPEPWGEECLGGDSNAAELLHWSDATAPSPSITDFGSSFKEYTCEWKWQPDTDGSAGQRLYLRIVVFEEEESSGFEHELDQSADGSDWRIEADSITGFEHGLCRSATSNVESWSFECMAADSNLEIFVESRPIGTEEDFSSAAFGPEEVPIEELTVELGELVRETFAR